MRRSHKAPLIGGLFYFWGNFEPLLQSPKDTSRSNVIVLTWQVLLMGCVTPVISVSSDPTPTSFLFLPPSLHERFQMVESLQRADTGRKTYVLDTNVFLYDPNSLFVFKEHDLVIPITVIEEVDHFKKNGDDTGRNARTFSRHMDGLRRKGSLSEGVRLDTGGIVRVSLPERAPSLPVGFGGTSNDNLILQTVLELHRRSQPGEVVLVTRDTNMRLKADALGVEAEDYEHAHLDIDEQYSGCRDLAVDGEIIGDLG